MSAGDFHSTSEKIAAARERGSAGITGREKRAKPDWNSPLFELILEPYVRERLGLVIGDTVFSKVAYKLIFYDVGLEDARSEHRLFDGFQEWMQLRHGCSCCTSWVTRIVELHGDCEATTAKFFELWDSFREEIEERGLESFFEEYRTYEVERYGGIVSNHRLMR